jgi:hypothetical protein
MTNFDKFVELSNSFRLKINNEYKIRLQFEISDLSEDNFFQVEIDKGTINIFTKNEITVEEIFVLSSTTLNNLYLGKISPLTAYANEPNSKGEMVGLINPKLPKKEDLINSAKVAEIPESTKKDFYRRLHVFSEFFNKHPLSKVVVNDKSSRILHGVKGIGLYHEFDDPNQLQVYFKIERNETLWQQNIEKGIFVINGEGKLSIDNEEYEIKKYEYYRIRSSTTYGIKISNYQVKPLEIMYI